MTEQLDTQLLKLGENDFIICKVPRGVTNEFYERVRRQLEKKFPVDRCVVVTDDIDLRVSRPLEIDMLRDIQNRLSAIEDQLNPPMGRYVV